MIYKQTSTIKGAQILAFAPPMVPGFSATNGLTFSLQDKTGGDLNKFFSITQDYLKALNARPEIATAMTSYNPNYPQYMVDVDVAKSKQAGTSPAAILSALQGILRWSLCQQLQCLRQALPCNDSGHRGQPYERKRAEQHLCQNFQRHVAGERVRHPAPCLRTVQHRTLPTSSRQ